MEQTFKVGDLVRAKVTKADHRIGATGHSIVEGQVYTVQKNPGEGFDGVYVNDYPFWFYPEVFEAAEAEAVTLDDLRRVVSALREQGMTVEVKVTQTKETVL